MTTLREGEHENRKRLVMSVAERIRYGASEIMPHVEHIAVQIFRPNPQVQHTSSDDELLELARLIVLTPDSSLIAKVNLVDTIRCDCHNNYDDNHGDYAELMAAAYMGSTPDCVQEALLACFEERINAINAHLNEASKVSFDTVRETTTSGKVAELSKLPHDVLVAACWFLRAQHDASKARMLPII